MQRVVRPTQLTASTARPGLSESTVSADRSHSTLRYPASLTVFTSRRSTEGPTVRSRCWPALLARAKNCHPNR